MGLQLAQHEVGVNRLPCRIDLERNLGQPIIAVMPSTDLPLLRAIVMLQKESGATVDVLIAVAAVADNHLDVAPRSNELLRALQIEGEVGALLGVLVNSPEHRRANVFAEGVAVSHNHRWIHERIRAVDVRLSSQQIHNWCQ